MVGFGHLTQRIKHPLDGRFHPVGEIRDTRHATARQRRALAVRDQGCIFTGCDRPAAWSHAHHVDTWQATHQTTVPRLALLCSFHHHQVHDHGFTLQTTPDGTSTIHRPDGTLLPTPASGHQVPPDEVAEADGVVSGAGLGPPEQESGSPESRRGSSGAIPPVRAPSRFRPLTRKRSRTHLNADLYFQQAGQTIEVVLARPRR